MPEWETRPANHYLPRQVTPDKAAPARTQFRLGDLLKPLAGRRKQGSGALEEDHA